MNTIKLKNLIEGKEVKLIFEEVLELFNELIDKIDIKQDLEIVEEDIKSELSKMEQDVASLKNNYFNLEKEFQDLRDRMSALGERK